MIYASPVSVLGTLTFTVLPNAIEFSTGKFIKIINQSTNVEVSNSITSATYDTNDILTVSTTIDDTGIIENNYYTIELFKGAIIWWRGILFCSSQTKSDYTINKDEFKETTSNNEYIILD